MAGSAHDYQRGEMDIAEQRATFDLVMALTKWGSLYIGAFVLWLVLWFCTEAGVLAGAITAAVVVVLGTLLLRERKATAH